MNEAEVKIYSFLIDLDGTLFGGEIPARSFEEARALVPTAIDMGLLLGCVSEACGDNTTSQPVEAEGFLWPPHLTRIVH